MNKQKTKDEQIFSASKKILRAADRIFERNKIEFIMNGTNGRFSIYLPGNKNPICLSTSVLKTLSGFLFFDFGVGKSFGDCAFIGAQELWEKVEEKVPDVPFQFKHLENALQNGGILYYQNYFDNRVKDNVFVMTSPSNLSIETAEKIAIRDTSFSNGLFDINSICSLYKYSEDFFQ